MKQGAISAFFFLAIADNAISERSIKFRKRSLQQVISTMDVCPTMIPPSPLAPDDSTCWQWWDPPASGVLPDGTVPPKGCDYKPCEDAVCACDDYCCNTAWDLSCRGYEYAQGDASKNNYFVDGCSAKILCCEQESAFPDPPVGGAVGYAQSGSMSGQSSFVSVSGQGGSISGQKTSVTISGQGGSMSGNMATALDMSYQCTVGSPNCCATMKPPSFLAPDDSTCWQWWDPPADGVLATGTVPPKGCNYKPCQDAVCACDDYCCTTAWDLSCRGYEGAQGDASKNNYFVDQCSAKILCCEQESAYPDPPVGGAIAGAQGGSISMQTGSITINKATTLDMSYQCTPGSPNCCPTMIPPSFLAPDTSTCWQWWTPPANGVVPAGVVPPKGCDYQPCQDAVCACDSYCCDTAWDESCRGYQYSQGDATKNNYFVKDCSAKMLCCEQETATPKLPIGGAQQYVPPPVPPVVPPPVILPPVVQPPPVIQPPPVKYESEVNLNIQVENEELAADATETTLLYQVAGKKGGKTGRFGYGGKKAGYGGKKGVRVYAAEVSTVNVVPASNEYVVAGYGGKKGYGKVYAAEVVTANVVPASNVNVVKTVPVVTANVVPASNVNVVKTVPVGQVQYNVRAGKGGKRD